MFSICLRLVVLWSCVFNSSMFSSSLLFVSEDGSDDGTCEKGTPCRSISHACDLGESPRQVMVNPGLFEETQGVIVEETLSITGQSSSNSILTMMDNTSFTLFTISDPFANLTLSTLTMLLSYDTNFMYASASDHIVINGCQITMRGSGTLMTNPPFHIFGENIAFQITACLIHNISASIAFIQVGLENGRFSIAKSSFVNVGSNGNGGCFSSSGASSVSLTECFFSECSSNKGGIGFMDNVNESDCTIQSCTFLNSGGTDNGGGVLFMNGVNKQSLTISETSFFNCTTRYDSNGGVLYLNSNISANLSDCSFTRCTAQQNGGALFMNSSCTADISRCTFIECSAVMGSGGAMYVENSNVSIVDSVFLKNSGTGPDCAFLDREPSVTFSRTFTDKDIVDKALSWSFSSTNMSQLRVKADYDNATCDGSFSANILKECQMPCAKIDPGGEGKTSACVKPDECPSGYTALGGQCVLTCILSAPGDNNTCDSPCVADLSRGYPLCVPCAARKADSTESLPCGSTYCFRQISNGGSGEGNLNTSCALSCDTKHFVAGRNGICELLLCKERRVDSLLKYPCGTADCYQQGAFTDECGDPPSQTDNNNNTKGKGLSPGIIILIIVGSVVGVIAALVVTGLVVWKKRRQKAYLKSDWILRVGAEVKDYLVFECERIVNQDADMYVFVRGDDTYTVKVVRSKRGICSGDLSWAVDFSAKVNSRFLVRYIETINGNKGEFYVVMEYCAKGDLRSVLKSLKKVNDDTTLSPDAVVKLLIQVLLGLEVLHSKSIVHCDIGLSSIFFDAQGDAKIGNFGCTQSYAPWIKQDGNLLELEKMSYVPSAYHSSEYSAGNNCTYSTDMWCLGRTLVEIYVFPKEVKDIEPVQFINELVIPRELADIMSSLMDGDHENRPSAFALLQNPYIRERADQFDLLKYFPPLSATSE